MRLLATAELAGKRLKSVAVVSDLRRRSEELRKLQEAFAQWLPFAETLKNNANDPKANTELGWKDQTHVPELVRIMVDADVALLNPEDGR